MIRRGNWLFWLRAFLRSAAIAGIVLIAASWFIAIYISSIEREKAVEEALTQSDSLTRLFEHNILGTIGRIDRTLLLLRKSYEDDPAHFDLRKWAGQTALVGEETFHVSMIDADGFLRATTLDRDGPPVYLGDRSHIQEHLHTDEDRLYISQPVTGRTTKRLSLQLSRRLHNPDGSYAGLILISVDPNFIEQFYHAANLGTHGTITIRNQDDVILAAQGFSSDVIGRKISPGKPPEGKSGTTSGY